MERIFISESQVTALTPGYLECGLRTRSLGMNGELLGNAESLACFLTFRMMVVVCLLSTLTRAE